MKKIVRLTESDLVRLVKRIVNEQSESFPFKVGDTFKGIRDIDKKEYSLEVIKVGPAGAKWGMFKIMGSGKYQGQPLDGNGSYELYYEDGKLSGNMQMGKFEIVK